MRKILFILIVFVFVIINHSVFAENIHFGDYLYKHKSGNQYYKDNEDEESWLSKIEVFYYPDIQNPLKFAQEEDNKIEANEECVLLKFIQNKKQNIALISFLEKGLDIKGHFFAYTIYKYEKHPKKGVVAIKYVKKYMFNTNDDISKIGHEIRQINNDYMERMIITEIPKDIE